MKHPHSSVKIDLIAFHFFSNAHTPKEVGAMILDICEKSGAGDVAALEQYPFILNWRKGRSKYSREPIPPSVRRDVLKIGYCLHCGATKNLTVDHIKPVSKGGNSGRGNLQCLCRQCNRRKGDSWHESKGGLIHV